MTMGKKDYFRRHIFMAVLSLVLFSSFATAGVASDSCTKQQRVCTFVESLKSRVHAIVSENQNVDELLRSLANEVLHLQQMAKFAMGSHWKDATKDQQQQFVDAYGEFISRVYLTQLQMYSHYSMKIMSVRSRDSDTYAVRVRMVSPEERDDFVMLEFHIVRLGDSLKIVDVRLNNSVSVAVNHRSVTDNIVDKSGIDGAIAYFQK